MTQTIASMIEQGASPEEAQAAMKLFLVLRPALKVNRQGRVLTTWGDKTVLGLYRVVQEVMKN